MDAIGLSGQQAYGQVLDGIHDDGFPSLLQVTGLLPRAVLMPVYLFPVLSNQIRSCNVWLEYIMADKLYSFVDGRHVG